MNGTQKIQFQEQTSTTLKVLALVNREDFW